MNTCAICRQEFQENDRLIANSMETFIFKPASVPDVKMFDAKGKEISAAARLSPDELMESRKEHKKTAMATVFAIYGQVPLPENVFNVRHVLCSVQRTGTTVNNVHPIVKHAIRYQRSAVGRNHGLTA